MSRYVEDSKSFHVPSLSIMKTMPGEFEMLLPPSGPLARTRLKSSVPSHMPSSLMEMLLHTTEPAVPGANVIMNSSEQKSAATPASVPATTEARILMYELTKESSHHKILYRTENGKFWVFETTCPIPSVDLQKKAGLIVELVIISFEFLET